MQDDLFVVIPKKLDLLIYTYFCSNRPASNREEWTAFPLLELLPWNKLSYQPERPSPSALGYSASFLIHHQPSIGDGRVVRDAKPTELEQLDIQAFRWPPPLPLVTNLKIQQISTNSVWIPDPLRTQVSNNFWSDKNIPYLNRKSRGGEKSAHGTASKGTWKNKIKSRINPWSRDLQANSYLKGVLHRGSPPNNTVIQGALRMCCGTQN